MSLEPCTKAVKTSTEFKDDKQDIKESSSSVWVNRKEPFECSVCKRKYKTKDSLKTHLENVHKISRSSVWVNRKEPFECSVCKRKYKTKDVLYHHRINVHKIRDHYKCSFCKYHCWKQSFLKIHMESFHNKVKKPEPGLRSSEIRSLEPSTKSVETNTEIKEENDRLKKLFQLKEVSIILKKTKIGHDIEKSSSSRIYPISEEQPRSHEPKKKTFQCRICHQNYSSVKMLEEHMESVHKNRNSFECKICLQSFLQKSDMISHKRSVHDGVKLHQCSMCHYENYFKVELQKHIDNVHKNMKEKS